MDPADSTTASSTSVVTPTHSEPSEPTQVPRASPATVATASPAAAESPSHAHDDVGLGMQLDLLTLLVAVVGAGLLLGGVVGTFAGLLSLGIAGLVLYRIYEDEWDPMGTREPNTD